MKFTGYLHRVLTPVAVQGWTAIVVTHSRTLFMIMHAYVVSHDPRTEGSNFNAVYFRESFPLLPELVFGSGSAQFVYTGNI